MARVHVDYTVKSGPERLQALLPAEEVAKLQKTPFAIIQVDTLCMTTLRAKKAYVCPPERTDWDLTAN